MQWRASWEAHTVRGYEIEGRGEGVVVSFMKGSSSADTKVIIVLADGQLTEIDRWAVRLTPITDNENEALNALRALRRRGFTVDTLIAALTARPALVIARKEG